MASRDAKIDWAELDALDAEQLGRRLNEKWNTYPDKDVLCAWVAEMDFPLARPIRAVLENALATNDLGYAIALRDTGLAETFAARMDERFGWRIDAERCEVLSEVVQGLYLSLLAYSSPGEGAVVQTPIYPPFLSSVRETKRALVENRLVRASAARDARYEIDFDALAAASGPTTRLLMLCNPHNPTGRVFERGELERLATFALERDWIVVSDEIHGDLVHDGRTHIPFASLAPEVEARCVTLTSASKAFNIPGLRTAVAHFGSRELQERFAAALPRHVRGGIGILGIYATIAAWRDSQPWLDSVRGYIERNRDAALTFLAERCPEVATTPLEATYLMWLDFGALELAPSPARFLYEHARVALSDGRAFGPGLDGFARLNLATSRPILLEILERIAAAIERR